MTIEERLQRVLMNAARARDLAGVIVRMEGDDDSFTWEGGVGELEPATPFFIASVTKLYTSAIVLRLAERRQLRLADHVVHRLDPELVKGLNNYRGTDHTDQITIRHLLSHTSGLADYFSGKRPDGGTLERIVRGGKDLSWTFEDVLASAQEMGPAFPPGRPGKALYSDTNFQLLGRLIEEVMSRSYAEALRTEVLEPLELERTWLYTDPDDARPLPLRDGGHRLHIPEAMASFGPDGGVVAPVGDLMRFLRGFFEGQLFDRAVFPSLRVYNRIFFPLQYGVGFARFKLPRIFSPFVASPELVGHSGLSGSFAFYAPAEHVYVAGTVNNVTRPGRPFRLMLRLLRAFRAGRAAEGRHGGGSGLRPL